MFYTNYDLASQILVDLGAGAMVRAVHRRTRVRKVGPRGEEHAGVIALAFGAHCDTEEIGA